MEEAQRLAALIVRRVLDGAALPDAMAEVVSPSAESEGGRRRALVQELAYGTLRHWGALDALVHALAAKPFTDAALPALVAVAIYQIEHTRAPGFAVVDHAVSASAKLARPAAKALVNALLRRYLRERDALNAAMRSNPVAQWSYPRWWIARVRREYSKTWEAILEAGNARPPLTLRVNARLTTRERYLAACAAADINASPAGAQGVIIDPPRPVTDLPGFAQGWFAVQDLGAQLAAPMLAPQPDMRILDACAAPGGKTLHIAELARAEILAIDSDTRRIERVRQNITRLGLESDRIQVRVADAGAPGTWWNGQPFDRILLDAPCTASGVVRRHPDVKWLRREKDIAAFARQQRRLLDALWPCLASAGRMLYVTCSIFGEENEAQIEAFCARHDDALREPLSFPVDALHEGGQLLPSLPGAAHNQDGFFYALLRKR